jgi:3-hydroxybutyryl-CoA dehydratase
MTQSVIDAWADLSGDRNPLHVDPHFARSTRFGGTIAHGHIALGYLCALLHRWAGPRWIAGGRLVDIRFIAPIRPGHDYEIGGEVVDVTPGEVWVKLHVRDLADGTDCIEGRAACPRDAPR